MDFDITKAYNTGSGLFDGIGNIYKGVTDFFSTGFSMVDVVKNVGRTVLGFAVNNASEIGSLLASAFGSDSSSYTTGGASNSHVQSGIDVNEIAKECAKYGLFYNSADGCVYDSVTKTMVYDATGKQIVTKEKLEELRKAYYNSSTGKNDVASQGWRGEYNKVTLLYWTFAGVI